MELDRNGRNGVDQSVEARTGSALIGEAWQDLDGIRHHCLTKRSATMTPVKSFFALHAEARAYRTCARSTDVQITI